MKLVPTVGPGAADTTDCASERRYMGTPLKIAEHKHLKLRCFLVKLTAGKDPRNKSLEMQAIPRAYKGYLWGRRESKALREGGFEGIEGSIEEQEGQAPVDEGAKDGGGGGQARTAGDVGRKFVSRVERLREALEVLEDDAGELELPRLLRAHGELSLWLAERVDRGALLWRKDQEIKENK